MASLFVGAGMSQGGRTEMTSTEKVESPRIAVSNIYHGVTVTEDYRWLEDATSEETDPQT
jgi:hypothetical protein